MSWRPLFKREIDVEVVKRQLSQCLSAIIQHTAVVEDFEDFRGRTAELTSVERAQKFLDFVGDRMSDNDFAHRIRQALGRKELKTIIRTDSTAPSGSISQDGPTIQRLVDIYAAEHEAIKRVNVAEWLSPLNFKASQIDHLQKREQGTGEWFLESQEFMDWRDGPPGTLWCPGSPGAGKTVLAAIIVEHLQTVYKDDNATITWIYCNYKDKAEQTIGNLIGSLLKQMVQNNKSPISKNIKELYEQHQIDRTRPPLTDLERVLISEFSTYSDAFVVVDAVDECPDDAGTQSELLRVLQTFSKTSKVLMTSRDVPTVGEWFGKKVVMRIESRDEDVRRYIQGRIDRKRKRHLKVLESEILDRVADRAGGMFLLARLLMDSIVEKVNVAGVRKVLEDMPKGIDGVYEDALERIREQGEEQGQLGEQILKWITFAFWPLSVEELQDALAVVWNTTRLDRDAITDEEILTSACAGLVFVEGDGGTGRRVRLIHHTAQSYFERTRGNHFPGAHKDIAKTCITYLSQDALLGIELPSYEAMKDLMEHHHLLGYASDLWGDHVREQSDDECDKMVRRFLEDEKTFLLPGQILHGNFFHMRKGFSGIHLSSFFGLEHIIKEQLLNGADPNQTDNQGQIPLAWATQRGHEKAVGMLLAQPNIDINITDNDNATLLLMAATNGHVKVVELLLTQPNLDIHFANNNGLTPLMCAAINGHVEVMELLLTQPDVDINVADEYGSTTLIRAAGNGHVKVVKLLLAQPNVDINLADKHGRTPFLAAATSGHFKVLELLLANKSLDINLTDVYGWTPAARAAEMGHVNVIELLLMQQNVDINLADRTGGTPFLIAAGKGHVNVVKLLLTQQNVDINLADKNGWTPLWMAAGNGYENVVKLLLTQPNVDTNLVDEGGQTPLWMAAGKGHVNVVKLLLTQPNVDINFANKSGQTPFWKAAESGHENVVKLLLTQPNVDINFADKHSWTPLLAAAGNGHVNVVKLLLTQPNIANESWAAREGHAKVVKLLIAELNLELHLPDKHHLTPLYLAAENGHREMVEFLLDQPNVVMKNIKLSNVSENVALHKRLDLSLAHTLQHESEVCCVCFSPDGEFLATGCNNTVQIYNTKTGVMICNLVDENTAKFKKGADIENLCFSPDGRYLAAGGDDRLIRIWDIVRKSIWRIFDGHEASVRSVDFSRDGGFIVSGSWDGTACIWDVATGGYKKLYINKARRRVHRRESPSQNYHGVESVAISPDGLLVATASDDIIRLWDTQSGALIERLFGFVKWVCVAFTPDGKGLVSGGGYGTVKHWDLSPLLSSPSRLVPLLEPCDRSERQQSEKGSVCMTTFMETNSAVASSVTVSQGSQWVVSGSEDGSVRFWDLHTGQAELVLWGHERVNSVHLSPTGGMLATGSWDGCAKLWNYMGKTQNCRG